jgi:hypothetical protein
VISAQLDFLGVNYYTTHTVGDRPEGEGDDTSRLPAPIRAMVTPEQGATTAIGWGIRPRGLTELLLRIRDEYTSLPLYVTENGAAYHDYVDPEGAVNDPERIQFLESHIRAAHEAIQRGVDLRGYFVWTLMDNFEWALGYSARFGIVFVDYRTQTRIPKASARVCRDPAARRTRVMPHTCTVSPRERPGSARPRRRASRAQSEERNSFPRPPLIGVDQGRGGEVGETPSGPEGAPLPAALSCWPAWIRTKTN